MKSSTIRRSNLSKEKMAVLEALSKYRQESYDNTPNVYVRPNKEKELDVLWQNFKISQKAEKSPSVYLATGFIAGVAATLLLVGIIHLSTGHIAANDENQIFNPARVKGQNEKLNLIPATTETVTAETTSGASEVYTVQNGDTLESILIRFYGGYSPAKATAVMQANNMSNPNKLSIGQKLSIPMN